MVRGTIHSFLEGSAHRTPHKTALVFEDRRYSYAELHNSSQSIVSFLCLTTRFQDRVMLLLSNPVDFIAAYFGVLEAGRIAVPADTGLRKEELSARINSSKPALALVSGHLLPRIKTDFPKLTVRDIHSVLQQSAGLKKRKKNRVLENTVASLLFTTGTTGEPKGVIIKHKNAVVATANIIRLLKYSKASIDVNALPLTHSFGLGNVHAVFAAGGTVILHKNFINLKKILEDLSIYRATSFSATPPILELLSGPAVRLFKKHNRSLRLILTNSAPVPPLTIKKIIALASQAKFFTYYGLTEASRSTFMEFSRDPARFTSVGKAAPGIKLVILDDNGKGLRPGGIGEIHIKGPTVSSGYWDDEKATRSKIKDGWLATGDFGYFDAKGYLFLTGRKDDVINIGGEKVYPHEIEEVLRRHKLVKEVAVVGAVDDLLGQAPKAVVVAAKTAFDEKELTEELRALCRRELRFFKVPKLFEFVKSMPKTSSGKLQKKFLY